MSTYVDVTVRDAGGSVIVQQRINMAARNHTDINIGQLLESAHSNATRGSVLISPATDGTGIGVIGQMSIAYNGSSQPSYLEYEPAKPNPANSLILRAVAEAGQSSPIVAITSVASSEQNVTVQCFGGTGKAFAKTVSVPPMATLVTPACNAAAGDPVAATPSSSPDTQSHAVGISLTTDAPPGSFAAVGFAPHHGADGTFLTAVPFSDPHGAKTSTTVFPGLPVGSATPLPGGYYVPELSVANFSSSPAHITVTYSRTTGGTPDVKTVDTLTVPPGATATADLQGLQGDPGLQNSFEVTSDQLPGAVLDNISSRSDTGIRWVELPGKDLQNSHNAGNHPWTVANGTDSTLLIFNETSVQEDFTVRVASGQIVWTKKYSLAPLETKAIDVDELIQNQVKDDSGNKLPLGIQSGQANWSEARRFGGTGRLLQSNPAQYAARSFSCGEYVVVSGGDFYPDVTSELVGQTNYIGTLYAQTSLVEDPVCYGEYLGDAEGYPYTYVWWSENSSIANIAGFGDTSDPEVEGLSAGSAQIDGDVSDQYGCAYSTGVQETVTGDQTPVITGVSPGTWTAGNTTSVTFTGHGFGTNTPILNFSDGSIGYTLSSHNDAQIVANITVPASDPGGSVNVSVTSSGYGGMGFYGAPGQSSTSSQSSASVSPIPAVTPNIKSNTDNNADIVGITQSVVVGQQIVLTEDVPSPQNANIASRSWSITSGGTAVGGYNPSTSGGSVVSLPSSNASSYTFYWVYPGNPLTVTYHYTLTNGQISPTVTATFNVSGAGSPNITIQNYVLATVDNLTGCTGEPSGPQLAYGNLTGSNPACGDPDGTPGITFFPHGSWPTGGSYFFVQIIKVIIYKTHH